MTRSIRIVGYLVLLACLGGMSASGASAAAATARDYAYLYLQGKISDPIGGRPLAEATVRLRGDAGVFETLTDRRGSFVFDRLPVRSYALEIIAADGRVMQNMKDIDPGDPFPDRARVRIQFGDGAGQSLSIETDENRVTMLVPQPKTRWGRLWKQLGIFIGAAGLLAL